MRVHAAVALLLLLLLAGCGGGGLSKSELVAKGDKICARVNKEVAKEPDPKSAADLERLAKRTVEISDPAIEDMEALEPPDELEKDFDAFVASLKRAARPDEGDRRGGRRGRQRRRSRRSATEAQKAQADYQKLAAKIGFKQCGGGN